MSKAGAPRWSQEQLDDYQRRSYVQVDKPAEKVAKASKYKNTKVEHDGMKFDSKRELARWIQLELMQKAGLISELQRQVAFILAPSVRLDGRMKPALRYFADATYYDDGKELMTIEDTKSPATRKTSAYRIKKHLLATVHGIEIKET